jgi:hypothetical protein
MTWDMWGRPPRSSSRAQRGARVEQALLPAVLMNQYTAANQSWPTCPHFHPSILEVKSSKKELVVKYCTPMIELPFPPAFTTVLAVPVPAAV